MEFDNSFVAKKIMRWGSYIKNYTLPEWNEIPDFGLYMEQVISLMSKFLNYLPPELSDEHTITPAAINNYVRKNFMPEPIKKKYYRKHIEYLLIICSLKTNLSINMIQHGLPNNLSDEELEERRKVWVCPEPKIKTGYLARYAKLVSSADKGAILE